MKTAKIIDAAYAIATIARVALLSLLLSSSFVPAVRAQENLRLAEDAIKVGLIYNLLHYTAWPAAPQNTGRYTVCVFGEDPFGGRLSLMAERRVNQRTISVQRLSDAAAAARTCSLVFVSAAEREHWPRLRATLAHDCVLTVSDFDGFAAAGGMIELTRVRDRIGIRINSAAVSSAGLTVEDRLLRLAEPSEAQR